MPTSIIDTSFHGTAFPATYTGPGTLIGNPRSDGPDAGGQGVSGFFTSNGNTVQINTGFTPDFVSIVNNTDGITWEWQRGMPAANSVKTVLGGSLTSAVDTTSQVVVAGSTSDGSGGNGTVTLGTTLCSTAKSIAYQIK